MEADNQTAAELEVKRLWKEIETKEFISVNKLIQFADQLGKLFDRMKELRESRDKWKQKYMTSR